MEKNKYQYRFIPLSPTKEAWEQRPFNEFTCKKALFEALKAKEKEMGTFNYLSGFIHFKDGFYSSHKDGTEPRPYFNPKWWKTGSKTCYVKNCNSCTIPEGETYDNTEPYMIEPTPINKTYQEFKRISGYNGAEEQFNEIKDLSHISSIYLKKIGLFYVEEIYVPSSTKVNAPKDN
jgi:hypothetical protein